MRNWINIILDWIQFHGQGVRIHDCTSRFFSFGWTVNIIWQTLVYWTFVTICRPPGIIGNPRGFTFHRAEEWNCYNKFLSLLCSYNWGYKSYGQSRVNFYVEPLTLDHWLMEFWDNISKNCWIRFFINIFL